MVDPTALTTTDAEALTASCADALERVRARAPRVHCVTNAVVNNFTANVLLCVGAIPSMSTDPDEIRAFVTSADALLVNLGTLDSERRAAIDIGIDVSCAGRRPWVLAAQLGLALSLLALMIIDNPVEQMGLLMLIGVVINSFAATQDVAVDGMAMIGFPPFERAAPRMKSTWPPNPE